jgi:hypothetical protein
MRKTRQQVINELFDLKKGLYNSIGELKHSVRSIFNNNTLMVTSTKNEGKDTYLICDVMSDVSSIKEENHSCKLTFLLNKEKGKTFIVDFDYNFFDGK